MYPDFSTGIVIGTLLGVLVSASLWGILFYQVQQVRRRQADQDVIAGAYVAQMSSRVHR